MANREGLLLVEARNGCLQNLFKACFTHGLCGRTWGERKKDRYSPLAGSHIIFGNKTEVVLIYQTDRGFGPIDIIAYTTKSGSHDLAIQAYDLLRESGLLMLDPTTFQPEKRCGEVSDE